MKYLPATLLIALATTLTGAQTTRPANEPGLFVAVGYGGFRGWSADGQHWTAERWSEKNADDDNIIFSLTFRDGIFLCSGGGAAKGFILRSTDGRHWDEVIKDRWRITGVLTLSDRFLSVFEHHFHTSVDGLSWQELAEASTTAADKIGGGYFRRWATGNGAAVFAGDYSLTGDKPRVGWIGGTKNGQTPMTLQKQSADVRGLAFGNGRFIACTADGNVISSLDGLEFKPAATVGDAHDDDCLRFAAGNFYLYGHKEAWISQDGENWKPIAHPPRLPRAISPGGVAVDCGWGGIQVATDGTTYHKAEVPVDPTGICAVVHGVPLQEQKGH